MKVNIIIEFKLYINKIIGAIFCQVNMIRQFIQFKPSIISGNQKWKGAAPIFRNKAEFIKIIRYLLKFWGKNSKKDNITIIENSKKIEANAWVIKYLRVVSEEYIFFEFFIKGIIDIKLISKPIHILNHE